MNRIILAVIMSLLCVSTAHSKVTYLHSNPQGSIVAATDETGNQLWVKRYTPYGTESEAAGTVSDSGANHGYATHEVDKETGLVYMKARYYDPVVGKFYSVDPAANVDGFNLYRYSANTPLNFTDSSGMAIDIFLDAAFISYDLYVLATDPSWGALAALGLDIVGAALPLATGLGASYRGTSSIGNAAGAVTDLKVIGRQVHTSNYIGAPGYDVLNVSNWNMQVNYNWVQEGIMNRQPFFLATEVAPNALRSAETGWGTVFSQEIGQLERFGYQRSGSFYNPGSFYSGQQYFNGIGTGYNFYSDFASSSMVGNSSLWGGDSSNSGNGYSFGW